MNTNPLVLNNGLPQSSPLSLPPMMTAPVSPSNGEIYYDALLGLRLWNSATSQWITIGGATVAAAPIGNIISFGGPSTPADYLLCNGAAVSRTTYIDLFNAIGTAWGIGDGSTTFNVPDLRGYFIRGQDQGAGNDPDAASRTALYGGNTGDNVGSYEADVFASHAHSLTAGNTPQAGGPFALPTVGPIGGIGTSAAGGNETRPKNANVLFCIKYTSSSVSTIVKSLSTGTVGSPSGGPSPVLDSGGVNPVSVTIQADGGDLEVGFMPDGITTGFLAVDQSPTFAGIIINILRDGTVISSSQLNLQNNITIEIMEAPPGSTRYIDTPTKGSHVYTATIQTLNSNRSGNSSGVFNCVLYARRMSSGGSGGSGGGGGNTNIDGGTAFTVYTAGMAFNGGGAT